MILFDTLQNKKHIIQINNNYSHKNNFKIIALNKGLLHTTNF